MDGDMSDIFQKLNSMLSDKETSENLKNILNNFSSSNSSENSTNSESNQNNNSTEAHQDNQDSSNFNFDIETILKLKSVMDAVNSNKSDARSKLLLSLKPYLRDSKQSKIDQYIKILNLINIITVINPIGGENNKHE